MINLKPIEKDLKCKLLPRGDKIEILQKHLIDNGFKFLESCKYIDNFNWEKYEEGTKMTNKEIKDQLKINQLQLGGSDYPKYDFKVIQDDNVIKIYWEYLDGGFWIVDKGTLVVRNEHNEFMNHNLEFNSTLKDTLRSIVYFMISRY